jgi:hypothetical protein
VGIPYLCWSVIYFLCTLPVSHYPSTTVAFRPESANKPATRACR